MTKVQAQFELERTLQDSDAEAVGNAHSYYGIMRVLVAPSLDRITVDYDATRLCEKELQAALIRVGVPVKQKTPAGPSANTLDTGVA